MYTLQLYSDGPKHSARLIVLVAVFEPELKQQKSVEESQNIHVSDFKFCLVFLIYKSLQKPETTNK